MAFTFFEIKYVIDLVMEKKNVIQSLYLIAAHMSTYIMHFNGSITKTFHHRRFAGF